MSPPPGPDQAFSIELSVTSRDLTEKTCSIVHRFYILAQHPILAILRLLGNKDLSVVSDFDTLLAIFVTILIFVFLFQMS